MPLDRNKILQVAAKYVDKKKYDKAINEYTKLVQKDPRDARTLLKIGDIQSRQKAFPQAIATYDRVAGIYADQGFSLKAIAVFKQIRELITKHAPELSAKYSHITPRLADIYASLNLVTDALSAYDEVANQLQKTGQDAQAIEIFEKMVLLDKENPLPYLRLAEACCRVQDVDQAIEAFWTASQLLLKMQRPTDALKVIERIWHFRPEPRYARAAAELYLKKNEHQAGLSALAKLQVAFQANSKDLETLGLLAQAFEVIAQPEKSIAVHVEMGRVAHEQKKPVLFQEIVEHLQKIAPDNQDVQALSRLGPPESRSESTSAAHPDKTSDTEPDALKEPVSQELDANVDEVPATDRSEDFSDPEDDGVDMIPDAVFETEQRPAHDSFQPRTHAQQAIDSAEQYRKADQFDQAVSELHIALESEPNSIPIREKLREILVEAGERDGAIQETLNLAIIQIHNRDPDTAEALAYEILEIEPEHSDAHNVLAHVLALREEAKAAAHSEAPSYDLEGTAPAEALEPSGSNQLHAPTVSDIPGPSALPRFTPAPGGDVIENPSDIAPTAAASADVVALDEEVVALDDDVVALDDDVVALDDDVVALDDDAVALDDDAVALDDEFPPRPI
ncbi:MAG: tetratricopeptide repeat protein, partial [Polyangiaceae bacterium]|nr:tetratricopeptide repeat protein [Polyangiaceae bacterium]